MAEPAHGPRPLILLTNDDGVQASGLRLLRHTPRWPLAIVIFAPTRE